MVPDLKGHIDGGYDDERRRRDQKDPGRHVHGLDDRLLHRQFTQGQQIAPDAHDGQGRHDPDQTELAQSLDQLHQSLHREHALESGDRIELGELGHERLGREVRAADQDRPHQGDHHEQSEHGRQDQERASEQVLEMGRQQALIEDERTLQRPALDHQLTDPCRHTAAEEEQKGPAHEQDDEGIELARARDLPFLARFAQAFGGGGLGAFLAVFVLGHGSDPRHPLDQRQGREQEVADTRRQTRQRQQDDEKTGENGDRKTDGEDVELGRGARHHAHGQIDQQQ